MGKSQLVTPGSHLNFQQDGIKGAFVKNVGQALFRWETVIVITAVLLGRAEILSEVAPFALPFFGVVFLNYKDKAIYALIGLLAGSITLSFQHFLFTSIGVFLFLLSQAIIKRKAAHPKGLLPAQVFFITVLVQPLLLYVFTRKLTVFDMLTITIEGCLALILSFIFMYSVPVLIEKGVSRNMEIEEVICFILLIAAIITGTSSWIIYGIHVEHVLTRYVVLVGACIGGAAIGATTGVVMGMTLGLGSMLNLYQMSLLSFGGLLGGVLKESKKFIIGSAMLVSTALISMYNIKGVDLFSTFIESGIAMMLLVLTPRVAMNKMAKYLPNTQEREEENHQYIRKLRDLTAQKVNQFAGVFSALSSSFQYSIETEEELYNGSDEAKELFLLKVAERTCKSCPKADVCGLYYENRHSFDMGKKVLDVIDAKSYSKNEQLLDSFENMCVNSRKVLAIMENEYPYYQANLSLRTKVHESRKLVADQLQGVAEIMTNFAEEIVKEEENNRKQEFEIIDSFRRVGIELKHLNIFRLEKGRIDVEIMMDSCNGLGVSEKVVAPMLSSILHEHIVVLDEQCHKDYCKVKFGTAQKYVVETAVTAMAKGGGAISGDSFAIINLGAGKQALAISDGMGNGERAHLESTETLRLLKKILKSGINEEVAIKSINSILALRTTDEIYSTLDLAVIDLHDGHSKLLKIGAMPSFVKRGRNVMKLESSNLPMGVIKDMDLDTLSFKFNDEDILIMVSDGIFEGPKHVENFELWLSRRLREITLTDPQEIADYFVDSVINSNENMILDDMTIIVMKFKHNSPKWASIDLGHLAS